MNQNSTHSQNSQIWPNSKHQSLNQLDPKQLNLSMNSKMQDLDSSHEFFFRHIGPNPVEIHKQLEVLNMQNLEELISKTVPSNILLKSPLQMSAPLSEADLLKKAKELAQQNKVFKSYIGTGYYNCITPNVILRNILENPGWYTAYTPYQAEISQGRLEALINFQSMIMDLTSLDIANASLLDEGTAAAEAMNLCHSQSSKKLAQSFFVSDTCHPQTIEVVKTRAKALHIEVVVGNLANFDFAEKYFAVLVQYPNTLGIAEDYSAFAKKCHDQKINVVAACDLLSLCLLTPPGEWGADVAVGSAQRFGVPMGFGGPHAGYMATKDSFKRSMPGRIIGVSIDANQKPAMRLALQTREQHIRREKATSNICTAQVLLAVMAGMYAVYHGPQGLKKIALRTHRWARILAQALQNLGYSVLSSNIFDTVCISTSDQLAEKIKHACLQHEINLRYQVQSNGTCLITISCDENTQAQDIELLLQILSQAQSKTLNFSLAQIDASIQNQLPENMIRRSEFLTQSVFNQYHSETELLRYIHRLQAKDLSLTHSMIPLGSCTMKLNATTEMIPVTWPEFSNIHPHAPRDQVKGYLQLISELEEMLCEVTGFDAVSIQPNAGSQGEYAGLLAIQGYHHSRGQTQRDICLIPSSAHGTNPASAALAGMKVVIVNCDTQGNIDVEDLRAKAEQNKENLAALMITYPSTHGVFEESITQISEIIHQYGGQVYMDGANFNALVGLCKPGEFGPDVCHLNLHKTFCIPHGGGGPGVGPVCAKKHLANFLPHHEFKSKYAPSSSTSEAPRVSSADFGSSSILCISWAYIKMMSAEGLKLASQVAILNANYIAKRLESHYPVLYKGKNGLVAHECIIDLRPLKATSAIEAEDVAKRLMDYGFHAPTMSWPVAGTLMIEPTESESKAELDRFCEAMIQIRQEISQIENGKMDRENNPLKRAPHPQSDVLSDNWDRPYSRETAAFPNQHVKNNKFWPSVARVNNPHGDRNLVCSCEPLESYLE